MNGRKRHLLVDTQGFVLKVVVSAADVQDRDGARLWRTALRLYGPDLPRLSLVWADAGYAGPLADDLRQQMGWTLAVVKRSDLQPRGTFTVQPHRWIVERTFSWWGGLRRLEQGRRIPGRVERGPDLRRHEPPHAATPEQTGTTAVQPGWITFKTVS